MLIAPHTLSVITTYKCTAACEHCCFGCDSEETESIPPENIRKYIQQATEIPSIKVVVFTGGECFMLGKELDNCVKCATDLGFMTRFVSNGYWATSREAARRRLEKLVACGLREANFSTGEQHAEYVRPEYVRNGAIAAAELGLTTLIMVEAFGESKFDFDAFTNDPDFQRHIQSGTIVLKISPWMKFHGPHKITYTPTYLAQMENNRNMGTGCPTALKVLAVMPSEHLCLCCGLTLHQIPEMWVGSLRQKTIKEILAGVRDDFIKIWIHLYGPDAILRYAQKLDPSIKGPHQQAHTCDVCRFVYRDERIMRLVKANPPPNMREIVAQYSHSLVIPMTELDSKTSAELLKVGGGLQELKNIHRGTVHESKRPATKPVSELEKA